MKSDALIEEMVDSPELPFVIHRLQAVLKAERPLRERFYDEITEDGKIEFINGKVVVQSPARLQEIEAGGGLLILLKTFVTTRKLGLVTNEKALVCLTRNDYEPDICFFGREKAAQLTPTQLKFPAPDWVCEVLSETTEKIDRTIKYQDYALHGIGEYWLVDCENQQVEIHRLEGTSYQLAATVRKGLLESRVICGFRVPIEAVFNPEATNTALRDILSA
jgi:Uma2 family endonuclease